MDRIRTIWQVFVSRKTSKRLLFAGLLYWLPVLIFVILAGEILERETPYTESSFLMWLHSASSPALDQLAIHVTNAGDFPAVILLAIIGAGLLLKWSRRSDATALAFGVGGAAVLNGVLKLFFHRPRPMLWHQIVDNSGYSFPSGHAMMSSALAVSFILIAWNTRWRSGVLIFGAGYIFLVGLSRVYLGVHYPTDIAAGWCVSIMWVLIVRQILRQTKPAQRPLAALKQP